MACAALLADHMVPPTTAMRLDASSVNALLLMQVDHSQLLGVAILQLLRCAATDGADAGELGVMHANDSPEIRLLHRLASSNQASTDGKNRFSTLPHGVCSSDASLHPLSQSLDFRCHAPGGTAKPPLHLSRPITLCLREIVGGNLSSSVAASLAGATRGPRRRSALVSEARLLLERGMHAAAVARLARGVSSGGVFNNGALWEPRCRQVCQVCAWPPRAASLPSRRVTARALRHPLPIGTPEAALFAEADGRPLAHARTHRTRPADAIVARAAASLLSDGASLLPPSFDARFTNPCWRCNSSAVTSSSVSGMCCLPYAHIIGVSKCGTTDLYARLANHPFTLRSANKGPHFWDESHSFAWYIDLYRHGAQQLASGAADARSIFIDASSNTLSFSGVGVRGAARPAVLLPQILGWLQPNVRLLLMLREPAERYYSAYWYYNKRYRIYERFGPHGAKGFAAMASADVAAFDRCRQQPAARIPGSQPRELDDGAEAVATLPPRNTARRCARKLFADAQQLVKGIYSIPLESWLAVFPPEQMLIFRLEDYQADLADHLQAAISFLGLPNPPAQAWGRMLAQRRANRRAPGGESMHNGTASMLRAFYRPFNEELARLLGDSRYLSWHEEPGAPMGAPKDRTVPF